MPMNLKVFLLLQFWAISMFVNAQTTFSGIVSDNNSVALPLVNVVLFSQSDSTIVTAAVTDESGMYQLTASKGNYIARYSHIGYSTSYTPLHLGASEVLPEIHLAPASTELAGIQVKGNKPVFKLDNNALSVNIGNDKTLSGQTNVYDMLGLIPGLLRTSDGVSVIGKGAPVYYINGRKIVEESEISSLQVDQIQSVKVINGKDVRYDAGNSAVIAIKVKNPDEGLFFNVNTNETFARYFSQNYGANLSYSKNNWDLFFTYSYNHSKNRQLDSSVLTTYADTLWNKTESLHSILKNNTHNYKLGVTRHFSPRTQLSVQYIGGTSKDNEGKTNEMSMIPDKGNPTLLNTNVANREKGKNHHLSTSFKTAFGESWNLDAYGDYIHKSGDYSRNIQENDESGMSEISFLQNGKWDIYALHAQLSKTIKGGRELSVGYDFSHTDGTDKLLYNTSIYNNSSHNKETRNSFYVNYSFPVGLFSFNAGVRYERLNSKIRNDASANGNVYDAGHLLPSIGFNTYNKGVMQSFTYSVDTRSPEFSFMNNLILINDRYSAGAGNLNLKAETNHSINYMLMYKIMLFTLNYEYIHHPLMSYYYSAPENSSVIVGSVQNFDHRQNINAILNFRKSIKRITPSLSFILMKSIFNYPGLNNTILKDSRPVFATSLDVTASLPKDWLLTAKYYHNWGGDLQMIRVGKESSFDVSLKKRLLKDRLTLSLDAKDIFDKSHAKASWQMNNLLMRQNSLTETRKITFSLVYRFRQAKSLYMKNAASKEMNRLKINEDFSTED